MKFFTLLFRRSPGLLALAVLLGVIGGASNAGLLALINTALHHGRPWEDARLLGGFVALCLLLPVTRAVAAYVLAQLGQKMVLTFRMELTRRILSSPLVKLEEYGGARLLVALTGDVATLVAAMSSLPSLAIQTTIVVGCLTYLGVLSWQVLLGTLFFIGLGVFTYQLTISRGTGIQRLAREQYDILYAHIQSVTGGLKEIKLHAPRREALLDEMDRSGQLLRRYSVRSSIIFSTAAGWAQLLVFMMVGLLLFAVPNLFPVDLKTLTGYALILLYIATPLDGLLGAIPDMIRAGVSWERLQKLGLWLDQVQPPAAVRPPRALVAPDLVELRGVTHTYRREGEDGSFTLGPMDLALRKGEVVFIVGGNGSGKTTLAKLILGLYAPESGAVVVDGQPIDDATREAYMQQFAVVFSDFFLFDSLLGLEGADLDERASGYLEALHLSHKVRVEGGKLSTTALSQGQRKRLALLTAYLEDRPIYLFDEWAADQDPTFKRVFYHRLLPELKERGKTVVVITHDDQYFGLADRVVKLDGGAIVYDGDPDGIFHALQERASVETPLAVEAGA